MNEFDIYFVGKWSKIKKVGRHRSKRHTNRYRFVNFEDDRYIEIELPDKTIAMCSIEDEKFLKRYHWNLHSKHGISTVVTENKVPKTIFLRRLVLNAKGTHCVNHINGDQLDCRRENLEIKKQIVRQDLIPKPKKIEIYYPEIVSVGKWYGGKPAGCISEKEYSFVVRFSSPRLYKTFTISSYDTKDDAFLAAERFRYKEADRRGLVRNKIRKVTLTNGEKCLEVQLNGERSFFCDTKDIETVEKVVWSTISTDDRFYVSHSARAKTEMESERFHVTITGYTATDHINGNGLDNRSSNLREGKGNVNSRNCKKRSDNTSGVTGVTYTKGAWIVQWPEDGVRKSKRFGSSYGTKEEAKEAAIAFRLEKAEELELHPRQ